MEIVWFDELPPYPVRSFTYRNEQVRAYTVSRVIVYNIHYVSNKLPHIPTGTAKSTTNSKWHYALKITWAGWLAVNRKKRVQRVISNKVPNLLNGYMNTNISYNKIDYSVFENINDKQIIQASSPKIKCSET
jgi:hypothetical protein